MLNYKHMNRPPGFNTLSASSRAFLVRGTFLNPNEIVYASNVLSSKGNSSAFAQINSIYSFGKPIWFALTCPSSSMLWLMSRTVHLMSGEC